MRPPSVVSWPVGASSTGLQHRPALGINPELQGRERMAALAAAALDDCLGGARPGADTPILLASCNGGVTIANAESWGQAFDMTEILSGTPWQGLCLPVVSAACVSGLHALYLASRLLAAGAREVVILAVDITTAPALDSFEALHVLAVPRPGRPIPPWHHDSGGFVLGEAAVALRLAKAAPGDGLARVSVPELTNDLIDERAAEADREKQDGLRRVLARLNPVSPGLVVGQGTGPRKIDGRELAAIAARFPGSVPITTALHHFGHTLGASGLLSVALAALAYRSAIPRALALPGDTTFDGRPCVTGAVSGEETIIACRALGGACAACVVGSGRSPSHSETCLGMRSEPRSMMWERSTPTPPVRDPVLRRVIGEAPRWRPRIPPDLLVVCLEGPLVPPVDARIGGRLLPSSVLEMTPGFVAQMIARAWGFAGPALSMIVPRGAEPVIVELLRACHNAGDDVHRVDIRGTGEHRDVVWGT